MQEKWGEFGEKVDDTIHLSSKEPLVRSVKFGNNQGILTGCTVEMGSPQIAVAQIDPKADGHDWSHKQVRES